VINVTPDSFYANSRKMNPEHILKTVAEMLKSGADFIDVGGFSSRPGAEDISPDEEKRRVLPAVRLISENFPEAIISVDTYRSEIAGEAVVSCGAHIINDISGGELDPQMFGVVSELNVPYILMHMQGTPSTMQNNPVYDDVVADILTWMGARINALRTAGIKDIIIDPGFGFGKTAEHNFEILRRLEEFSVTGLPLMIGLSRKSMIWKTLGFSPGEALNGTTVLNSVALLKGADILRVHDVREAVEACLLVSRIKKRPEKEYI
ncbi:MAG: dihydropteroate synthase, partial [Bacteroidales bacterium]|nr:dihydropteroate synthase [Bacteroidales bacterium]